MASNELAKPLALSEKLRQKSAQARAADEIESLLAKSEDLRQQSARAHKRAGVISARLYILDMWAQDLLSPHLSAPSAEPAEE